MSTNAYHQLQQNSINNPAIAVNLPEITAGKLSIKSHQMNFSQVASTIANLLPTDGWVMYRDQVTITTNAPEREDLLEGEWCNQHTSIKVKLLGNNQYLVTQFTLEKHLDASQCYKEQRHYLRANLLEQTVHNAVNYRQWYQQSTDKVNQGKWQPYAQQFMGFTTIANKEG